jgi:hypothetical protein
VQALGKRVTVAIWDFGTGKNGAQRDADLRKMIKKVIKKTGDDQVNEVGFSLVEGGR